MSSRNNDPRELSGGGARLARRMERNGAPANLADEAAKLMAQFKFPAGPNIEALMASYSRNMEAVASVNRIVLEGAQSVAQRQMEMMQQAMSELSQVIRAGSTLAVPHANGSGAPEWFKNSYERAVANMREVAELIQHSNGKALEQLQNRFVEGMEELKSLMQKGAGW